jgi:hypothetical protein
VIPTGWLAGAAAVVVALLSGWLTHRWDQTAYARLSADFSAYKAAAATANERAADAASRALQAQIEFHDKVQADNDQTMQEYRAQAADDAAHRSADAELIRRLLADAAKGRPAPSDRAVPKAADRQRAADASRAGGNDSLAGLLVDAAAECTRNADRLDALTAEVKPQL